MEPSVAIGDQMYIEKLMVNEKVNPSDSGMYKLASQLKNVKLYPGWWVGGLVIAVT